MLSHKILTGKDVVLTASYYEDAVDDYAKSQESSAWQGKGAEALELSGEVDSDRFKELFLGKISEHEQIGKKFTRSDSRQRLGIDLTFSAPKSVSLQALIHGDEAIITAHDLAVSRAIELAEQRAQARKKIQGKSQIENTGNLVVAKFRHETSRDLDPQLHTHAIVMNMTQRSDGQWRALKNDEIIKTTKYLGAAYRAELARELQELGYGIRHERDGFFELAHISREQVLAFSSRSVEIESALAQKGFTRESASTSEKQQTTLSSRKKKRNVDRDMLHQQWQSLAKSIGIEFQEVSTSRSKQKDCEPSPIDKVTEREAARRAVKYAVNHLTERQAIVSEQELIEVAVKHGMGSVRLQAVQEEINHQAKKGCLIREETRYKPVDSFERDKAMNSASLTRTEWKEYLVTSCGFRKQDAKKYLITAIKEGRLIASERRFTTQIALERERVILKNELNARKTVAPIMDLEVFRAVVVHDQSLNRGQIEAAELILTTENRVVGVQGYAGTGKSHMVSSVKVLAEQEGFKIKALAPYGSQVKSLEENGLEANTLASFVIAKNKKIDDRTVLVIDEAGVIPVRLMEKTLKIAEAAGTRVVLLGDIAQTKAIEAGRPFDQLQKAGMATALMDTIQRQCDKQLKKSVEYAAKGDSRSSLQLIKDIQEIRDHTARYQAIAYDYCALNPDDREKTIVVSGTNKARKEINGYIREGIGVAGQGQEFTLLNRRDSTQAERRYARNFHIGDVIQPERDYKVGLKRGDLYEIVDTTSSNALVVKPFNGSAERLTFSPAVHRNISVYEQSKEEVSVGDLVRMTRNDKDLDVANGDRFRVEAVCDTHISLSNGKRNIQIEATKPLHMDHAYVTTVHSSQGLTSDRVLIDLHAQSKTTAKDVFYVAISRARHEACVYTNDAGKLPKAVERENEKYAALDLASRVYGREKEKNYENCYSVGYM